jgi:hypothetical protein
MKSNNDIKVVEWIDQDNNKHTDLVGGEGKGPLYKELTTAEHERNAAKFQKDLIKIVKKHQKLGHSVR